MADRNYISYADTENVVIENQIIDAPDSETYSDTLKFSHAKNVSVRNCTIHGDAEDACDLNRECRNINFFNMIVRPMGKYGFTIKGGTEGVTLDTVIFASHGQDYDVDLGNWSDNSNGLTKDITLINVTSVDGDPVRVRVLWADRPTVIGGNVKVIVVPKIFVRIYRWLRVRNLVA